MYRNRCRMQVVRPETRSSGMRTPPLLGARREAVHGRTRPSDLSQMRQRAIHLYSLFVHATLDSCLLSCGCHVSSVRGFQILTDIADRECLRGLAVKCRHGHVMQVGQVSAFFKGEMYDLVLAYLESRLSGETSAFREINFGTRVGIIEPDSTQRDRNRRSAGSGEDPRKRRSDFLREPQLVGPMPCLRRRERHRPRRRPRNRTCAGGQHDRACFPLPL